MKQQKSAWRWGCWVCLLLLNWHAPTVVAQEMPSAQDEDMAELMQLLEEDVVMIASLTKERLNKAPASVTVITAQQIRDMGARTVTDVLQTIPGVETLIQEYGYTELLIRGGRLESQRVKFMINGHSVNPPRTGQPAIFFDDLTVENIERIEVIRGPGSALYGTNAFSGVVNIITKDTRTLDGIEVIAKGGSFDTWSTGVLFGTAFQDLKISGYAEYFETDGDDANIRQDAQSVLDQQFARYGVPAVSLAPDMVRAYRTKTDLNLDLSYHNMSLSAKYLSKVNGPYIGANYTLNTRSEWNLDYLFLEGQYAYTVHETFETVMTASWDRVIEDYLFQGSPAGFTIPRDLDGDGDIEVFPEGRIGRFQTSFDIFSGECQGIYRPRESHTFVLGAAIQETRQFDNYTDSNFSRQTNAALDPGELDTSPSFMDNRRTVWALFLQDQWEISDTLNLTLGVRHDHYSDFGHTTNPRAALVWAIYPDLHLKMLYGRAFLAPSFHELYLMNNPLMVGSDDLRPATIQTFEIGTTYRINDHITTTVTYFYNMDKDIITPAVQAEPNTPATFVNANGDRVQGIEVEIEAAFSDRLYGFLNYSFRDSTTQETHDPVPLNSRHLAYLGLNIPLLDVLNANLQAAFVGERPREPQDTREPTDAYVLLDATLRTYGFYKGLELFCSVHNLLDETYVKPSLANTFPDDYPLPGRTFVIGMRYAF